MLTQRKSFTEIDYLDWEEKVQKQQGRFIPAASPYLAIALTMFNGNVVGTDKEKADMFKASSRI